MVDERPSKKPRTQSNALDAAAHATIARANSHVQQQFLRRGQWNGARETESAPALSGITTTAPAELGRTAQDQGQERGSGSGYGNGLVQYESPAILESSSMHTSPTSHVGSGGNFADAANTTLRSLPSLPSPAPSDEVTRSPIIAEGQLGQFGARQGHNTGPGRGRTPADGVATHIPTLSASASASASPLSAQSPTFPLHSHQQFAQIGMPQTSFQQGTQPQPHPRERQQSQQQGQQQARFQQQLPWQVLHHYSLL